MPILVLLTSGRRNRSERMRRVRWPSRSSCRVPAQALANTRVITYVSRQSRADISFSSVASTFVFRTGEINRNNRKVDNSTSKQSKNNTKMLNIYILV